MVPSVMSSPVLEEAVLLSCGARSLGFAGISARVDPGMVGQRDLRKELYFKPLAQVMGGPSNNPKCSGPVARLEVVGTDGSCCPQAGFRLLESSALFLRAFNPLNQALPDGLESPAVLEEDRGP